MQPLPQNVATPPRKANKRSVAKTAQDIAYKALRSKGITQEQAALMIGIHPSSAWRYEKRLKAEAGDQDLIRPLVSAARDEKLGRLVDHFLDKGVKLRSVKGSDAIAAGKLYADRRYPARTADPTPAISFTQVNLIEIRDPDPTRYGVPAPGQLEAQDPGTNKPPITLDISPEVEGPVMGIMSNE